VSLSPPPSAFEVSDVPPAPATQGDLVAWARGEIERVRQWMVDSLAVGRGIELVQTHTAVLDAVIRELHAWVEARRTEERPAGGLTVVAQGGYGRRQMCPHSDVDLLLLVDGEVDGKIEARIRRLVQLIWDLGIEAGHSVKGVKEALALAGEDFVQTTALFDARPLAGDPELFEEMQRGLRRLLDRGALGAFLTGKIEEMRGRHAKYDNTVYLLEPNVKEGEGGLRDVHMCQWIGFACLGSGDLRSLAEADVLRAEEVEDLIGAWDFLLTVRSALHVNAGRRVDTLDFSRQRAVAQALGIGPVPGHSLAEEHLLHLFHRHARSVNMAVERVARILPRRTSLASRLTQRLQVRRLRGGWVGCRGEISPGPGMGEELFTREPGQMLEICAVARERGLRLSDDAREAIRTAVVVCDDAFRTDPANTERFLRVLRGPAHTAATLRAMNDCGLLTAYLPEWIHIQGMVRIDQYHRYTVDEHTLKSLEAAERLITGELDEQERGLTEAAHHVERWDLLMLALLLHDIGKGEGRGHVVRGSQIAQRIARRMGLDSEEADIVRELVLGHLLIPHRAFRRDLFDPAVIESLAKQVSSVEVLTMLFVLTFADISGVHGENWTVWKGQLIWTLYQQARRAKEGESGAVLVESESVPEITERLLAHLADSDERTRERAQELVASASPRYRHSVGVQRMAEHARLLARLDDETRAVWAIRHPENCNYSEVTVATFDDVGVFTLMCGALASKEINILSAQGYSTDDGYAIETFQVTAANGGPLPEGLVLDRVERLVNEVLRGERNLDESFAIRLGPPPGGREQQELAPTQIEFDNAVSANRTVIEVRTVDRPGLLHALTRVIADSGHMIYLAMISTEAYRAVDVFYLTDLEGMKIDDPKRIAQLRDRLTELLDSPGPTEVTQKREAGGLRRPL
jgi:[protein-PII] uridylyltransferase